MPAANAVHIAGRGLVVRQLRILVSQFCILRTGTSSEIRPDNMYHPSVLNSTNNNQEQYNYLPPVSSNWQSRLCLKQEKSKMPLPT